MCNSLKIINDQADDAYIAGLAPDCATLAEPEARLARVAVICPVCTVAGVAAPHVAP